MIQYRLTCVYELLAYVLYMPSFCCKVCNSKFVCWPYWVPCGASCCATSNQVLPEQLQPFLLRVNTDDFGVRSV